MKKFIYGFMAAIATVALIYFLQLMIDAFFTNPKGGDPPKGVVKNPSPGSPLLLARNETGFIQVLNDPTGHFQKGEYIIFYNSAVPNLSTGDVVYFNVKSERLGDIFNGASIYYGRITRKE
jgi:hypothetical protein